MAVVTFYTPYNMATAQTFYGTLTGATDSRITVTDGYSTTVYTGQFSYTNNSVAGTLKGVQNFYNNTLASTVSGLNIDATTAGSLIAANQLQKAFELALKDGGMIIGSKGNDVLLGYAANTEFIGNYGNDTIVGAPNLFSVANYYGTAKEYSVYRQGEIITIADHYISREGTDILTNISQAKFSDYTLVFDKTAPVDTLVYQIYQAAFARTPDNGGFRYWTETAEKQGLSALQLANSFTHSQEFLQKFGQNPTNQDYVTKLYSNVLGRAPDKRGLDYWVHQADTGRSHEQLLVDFATSPENVQLTGLHTANYVYWTT
jgi:hypothetical protein